ncbi:hypothetical protein [Floccifex sp.]|uniref:hypothetical protein n=1 Tax=Floccifex sp. TaxID=2815810 RepID=UPI003F09A26F
MKKILKWLIPCLVACFMVAGLVQTASFTFAEGQTVLEGSDSGDNSEVLEQIPNAGDEGTQKLESSMFFSREKVSTYADLTPDTSYIVLSISLNFESGISKEDIQTILSQLEFTVTDGQNTHTGKISDMIKQSETEYKYSWRLTGLTGGTYTVKQDGLPESLASTIDFSTSLTSETVEIEPMKLKWQGDINTSGSQRDYLVQGNSQSNKILIFSGTTGTYGVISYKELSESERLAIFNGVKDMTGSKGQFNGWTSMDNLQFYSLEKYANNPKEQGGHYGPYVKLSLGSDRYLEYYPDTYSNQNNVYNIYAPSKSWNAGCDASYEYIGGSFGDIEVTNTYKPKFKTITVTKEWLCDESDKTDVSVALYDSEGNLITDKEGKSIQTISLNGNGNYYWTIPKNTNVGYVRELSGENPIDENDDWKITLNEKTFKVEYVPGNVDPITGNQTFTVKNTKLCKLTVVKKVKGSAAVLTDEFNINVKYGKEADKATLNGKPAEEGKESTNTKVYEDIPYQTEYAVEEDSSDENLKGYSPTYQLNGNNVVDQENKPASKISGKITSDTTVTVINTKEAIPLTGIIDNTPKGLGMIGTIVAEVAAIAFVLKKKRQLKM